MERKGTLQDIETVYLDELREMPQEISGTLHRVIFYDLDGRDPVLGIVLANATVFTRDGRRLLLNTRSEEREVFLTMGGTMSHMNVVHLDKLLEYLDKLHGPYPEVRVDLKLKQTPV